jgi:hypothetical protein
LDLVYKQGDTYYVVEAKGRKAVPTARQVPGEFIGTNEPAYAMEGSRKYLDVTLKAMAESGDAARRAIALELQTALNNGKVVFLEVRTRPRPNGTAYYSVKKYNL